MKFIKQISLTLILLFCLSSLSIAAGDIVLNKYARIVELFNYNKDDPDSFRVAPEDINAINDSDTIVIYQAKGAGWSYPDGGPVDYRFAGCFEFHVVCKKTGDIFILPSSLNFYLPKTRMYETKNFVQAVKVTSYNKFIAGPKNLTADPWDSVKGKGGIFAMMVDTLVLNSNIDVTGKGFKGGNPLSINSPGVSCALTDTPGYFRENYSFYDADSAGLKGESFKVFDSSYMRGKMPLLSGGGGGNGYHAGGGGGSSYGVGGVGGWETNTLCTSHSIYVRGEGGITIKDFIHQNDTSWAALFGGGGGSGTQKLPKHATRGGNGGGIILLVANVLQGKGRIIANGESVTQVDSAGGGGGGGGGAIYLDINKYDNTMVLYAKGGKGGSTKGPDLAGPGGGGGGGYVFYNGSAKNDSLKFGLTFDGLDGGQKGTNLGDNKPSGGNSGHSEWNLIMPIKDVLFNVMPPKQEICEWEKPKRFDASHPKGGNGHYRYIWVRRTINKIVWDTIANNDTSITYQEGVLHDTSYYKRIVKSTKNGQTFTDISTILTVNVLPAILNDSIFSDTLERCKGLPLPYMHATVPTGGNNSYTYQWQDSTANWYNAAGVSTQFEYKPPQNRTVHLRRVVKSGVCIAYGNKFTLTVLPSITNYSISDSQWVSKGIIAKPLIGQTPSNGKGTYIYTWKQSSNKIIWSNASGSYSNKDYTVPLLSDTLYYKRIVFSGQFNTCRDTSNVLPVYVLDSIEHNSISGNQSICGRTIPSDFIGTKPIGGDTSYRYQWDKSSNGSTWDSSTTVFTCDTIFNPNIIDPGATHATSFVYFRRIVRSGHYDCCKDTSNTIMLTVRPYIKNNIVTTTDTIICYYQIPDSIIATYPIDGYGPYVYLWQDSLNNNNWSAIPGANEPHYKSGALTDTTYFRRKVTTGICTSYSNDLKIAVLDTIGNNIIKSDSSYVCKGSKPTKLNGQMPTGGEGQIYSYYWQKSINNSTWINAPNSIVTDTSYQPDTTSIRLYFKRIVKSGLHDCCINTSAVFTIGIHELPTDIITVFNDSLCLDSTYIIHHILTGQPDFKIDYTDGISNFDTSGVNVYNFYQPFKPKTPKIFNYSVTSVVDGNNCIAKKIVGSGILSVFNNPKANISGTKDSICERIIKLDAHPSYGLGVWKSYDGMTFDNNLDSATSATAPDYDQYSVTWIENNGGCIDSASIKISFFEQPKQSDVILGIKQEGPFKFRTTLDATAPSVGNGIWKSTDSSIYIADPANPKTFVDSLKFGVNKFIWTIINGVCTPVWDTFRVTTNDIKIPHGISPNFDNINDTFQIYGLEYTKNAELTIINKWGGVVYHSSDYKNDWTGMYKGNALPEDTYFYIIKVINRMYKGFLVIRR